MGRPVESVIEDAVLQYDFIAAQGCFDSTNEVQVLTEHGCLLHMSFAPKRAFVTDPMFSIADQSARDGGNTTMDGALHGLAMHIVVMGSGFLMHEEDVIEAACYE